ncbi:helix-turn-helix domain-containing protein [Lysobacter terrae]
MKQAREACGLSQRALGDLLGLGKQTGSVRINRYEQQVSKADMETAADIARKLDVPLAYLFAEADDLAEMILAFAKLTKAERAKVVAEMQQMMASKMKTKSR